MENKITEDKRTLSVVSEYDVIVAGGGIAGISAALSAAREGAKVLLVEREYALGGLATLGLVTVYLPICDGEGNKVVGGIGEELLRLSISHGAEHAPSSEWQKYLAGRRTSLKKRAEKRLECGYNPWLFAILAEQLLQNEGVSILYGTQVCGVKKRGNRITHLIVENKSGRYAYGAKAVVDATGDADVASLAGAPCRTNDTGNLLAAWHYVSEADKNNALRSLGNCNANVDTGLDRKSRYSGLDGEKNSELVLRSHRSVLDAFLSRGELTPTHTLNSIAMIPQLRMTRCIVGRETATLDMVWQKTSIGVYPDWKKRGAVYELPFGSLRPLKTVNLFLAGRNIAADDEAWDVTRVIPVCAVSGEAAGLAAAQKDSARISVAQLQKKLRARGIKIHKYQKT